MWKLTVGAKIKDITLNIINNRQMSKRVRKYNKKKRKKERKPFD